jgi:excisionase family DNA binding protein
VERTVLNDDFPDDSPSGELSVPTARSRPNQRLTVSVEEAGRLLGISRGHAYALVNRGEIPSLRLGRRIVVPLRALDRLLDPSDDAA